MNREIDEYRLKGVYRKNDQPHRTSSNLNKHCKSVILSENRYVVGNKRAYSKMNERCHSISDKIDKRISL
jgi:hypothetical protein